MRPVERLAEQVRAQRRPVAADNPFVALERQISDNIERSLDGYRDARDRMIELTFNAIYSNPWLRAVVGLAETAAAAPEVGVRDDAYEALVTQKIASLKARFSEGGIREAAVRILMYAGGDEPSVDTRGFKMLQRVREEHDELFAGERVSAAERRELFKNQFFMLLLDEQQALASLPKLLPTTALRDAVMDMVRKVLSARGELSPARKDRLARVESILAEPIPDGTGSRRGKA
jgi:hypothetical protein